MLRFFLILSFVILWVYSSAQDQTENLDSIYQVRKQRMTEARARREGYLKNLRINPRETLDSVRKEKLQRYSAEGLKRLEELSRNTRIDTLKTIDLSFAMLEAVPDFVFSALSAEKLILDYNHIRKLPKELAMLKKLKYISWKYNRLQDFWWIGMGKSNQLETLDISNNNLRRVPVGIRKFDSLKQLILDRNLFEAFPINRLAKASSVQHVSLSNCEWMKMKDGKYEKLFFLKELKMNNCGLDTLPSSFYSLNGLEELQLQRNKLHLLPNGISELQNLKKLSFYKNQLIDLPEDFFQLKNLKVIDLYYNQLTVIPDAIQNLKGLDILFLAHNKVYSLPESIGSLDGLKELYIHHNQLSVLPIEISTLKHLEVIRVNDNFLMDFPSQILGLDSLTDIDVSNNQISFIPAEIVNFQKLRIFSYNDNNIDFSNKKNLKLANSLYEMNQRGVVCIPRINKQIVREN